MHFFTLIANQDIPKTRARQGSFAFWLFIRLPLRDHRIEQCVQCNKREYQDQNQATHFPTRLVELRSKRGKFYDKRGPSTRANANQSAIKSTETGTFDSRLCLFPFTMYSMAKWYTQKMKHSVSIYVKLLSKYRLDPS